MSATGPNIPHDSKVNQILGVCSAMLVITTIVVAARIWTRLKLAQGGLGADDWCIIVAWVLAVAYDLDPINREFFPKRCTAVFRLLLESCHCPWGEADVKRMNMTDMFDRSNIWIGSTHI